MILPSFSLKASIGLVMHRELESLGPDAPILAYSLATKGVFL